ncbi:MAG TPA: AAA family ATPase [Candidatus Eisenbacteria bacterium]|nr:AAA family ATPase [Candidatus Eisenbacteria bacterium]
MEFDVEIRNYKCFTDEKPVWIRFRPGFTAFVGTNNAGKSSILKALYDLRSLFSSLLHPASVASAVVGKGQFEHRNNLLRESDERVLTRLNNRPLEVAIRVRGSDTPTGEGPLVDEVVVRLPRDRYSNGSAILRSDGSDVPSSVLTPFVEALQRDGGARPTIDVGRICAACKELSACMFIGPFRNALNLEPKEGYYDINVGTGFIKSWHRLKNHPDTLGNAAASRVAADIARVFRLQRLDINASADGRTLMVYRDGVGHTLEELGSGLAQFILALANAAIRQPSYLLVDEPELNLHPSLQIDFLTTLASYASSGVLFATHSIGLARTAETIYSVRQGTDGASEIRPFDDTVGLPELLGEMSFAGYRDLGFKTVLLVEGPTDVRTMQQFLRMWRKDHNVVTLSLGGSSMINPRRANELAEVTRIADRVVAVIDSEREHEEAPVPGDREGFARVCEDLKIRCHVLRRRALENYLTDRAVKSVKGDKYRALAEHERLRDTNPAWSKAENWRIAYEMKPGDVKGTDLHEILESL